MAEQEREKICAFQFKSGKEQVVFGLEHGVFSAIFESIFNQNRKELQVNLGGFDGEKVYLDWLKRPLEIGEKFELKVVRFALSEISMPLERRIVEPPSDDQLLKAYYDQKKELENAGLI
ncbi:hypothetical protein [Algoriphagus algorifonticola]|uniref:hypothetical protein n=1 Tax=Algoriphagus algorifonticola TaxID=2593007 RepID=UPI0011A98A5E|nr:hypothetical protein [Algoriphagus algorifonticola]